MSCKIRFFYKPKSFHYQKFYKQPSKAALLQTKNLSFAKNSLAVLKRQPFSQTKAFYSHKLPSWFSKVLLLRAKSFSFAQSFLNYHPQHHFSTLRLPFLPSHNLLSTKEHGHSFVVRSNSLRCNTGTSHRFKAFSPPFCAKSRVRHVPPEISLRVFPTEL